MTGKEERQLQKARNSKAGWMPQELIDLYESYGFIVREGKGSHKVISHPEFRDLRAIIPVHPGELPKIYVSKAVQHIDELLKRQKRSD